MFSFLKKESSVTSASNSLGLDPGKIPYLKRDESISFSAAAEIGGAKGWPHDASFILYHEVQSLLCVGTVCGSVHVIGDEVHYIRPCLTLENNAVKAIVALFPNRILVHFNDDSIVLMELPSLDVVHILEPGGWMSEREREKISCLHVDLPSEKNFIYVGTSAGTLHVLDASAALETLRICDYKVLFADCGLQSPLPIVDAKICPKDDKYVALAFSGGAAAAGGGAGGVVCVFDLVKRKLLRSYPIKGVAAMVWNHTGDSLFVGSSSGQVYSLLPHEKGACCVIWDAREELLGGDDDDDDGRDEEVEEGEGEEGDCSPASPVSVRSLLWMAPQQPAPPSSGSGSALCGGCLFVLLDCDDNFEDNDDLKNVVVGLGPLGPGDCCVEARRVFALPPIASEKLLAVRLLPSCEKGAGSEHSSVVSPALVLLTEDNSSPDRDASSAPRLLKVVRCPGQPIDKWALELGFTPSPRELPLMGIESRITTLSGFLCGKTPQSIATAMLTHFLLANKQPLSSSLLQSSLVAAAPVSEEGGACSSSTSSSEAAKSSAASVTTAATTADGVLSMRSRSGSGSSVSASASRDCSPVDRTKRLSIRAYLTQQQLEQQQQQQQLGDGEGEGEDLGALDFEIQLAQGIPPSSLDATPAGTQVLDMVVMGHADGSVILWGVLMPDSGNHLGRGNVWLPLMALRCGQAAVTAIAHDEAHGLLLAGDRAGGLVMWELFDEKESLSASSMLAKIYSEAVDIILKQLERRDDQQAQAQVADDSRFIEDYAKYWYRFFKYRPSTFRVLLRCQLPAWAGHATCGLLLSQVLTAVVGTDQGALLYFSDLRSASCSRVELELDGFSGGERSPVVSLTLTALSVGGGGRAGPVPVPAVLCVFANGHLLALEVKSWTVLFNSTGAGCGEGVEGSSRSPRAGDQGGATTTTTTTGNTRRRTFQQAAEAHVLDASFNELPKPDLISICRYRLVPEEPESAEATAAPPPPPPPAAAPASRLSSLFSSKSKAAPSDPGPGPGPSPLRQQQQQQEQLDSSVAKYAVLVRNGRLFMYTLPHVAVRSSSSPLQAILWTGRVSDRSTVSSALVRYTSSSSSPAEAEAESQSSFLAVACLSGASEFILVAARPDPSLVVQLPLLDGYGVVALDGRTGPALEGGVVLANGSCYMLQRGGRMLFHSAAVSNSHGLSRPLPDRGCPGTQPLPKGRALLHGREQLVEKSSLALKKRRSSVLGIGSAAHTDLAKLFSKTRDALQKEELLAEFDSSSPRSRASSGGGSGGGGGSAGRAGASASSALAAASELGLALEERGEKISQLAIKSDAVRDHAADFKASSAVLAQNLKKKSNRWFF